MKNASTSPSAHHNLDRNDALLARRAASMPRGLGMAAPILIDRADKARLWDIRGREFIDFAGGIAVMNVGHQHPKVMKRVREQLERFTHVCFMVTPYEPLIELAERLNAIVPIEAPAKTLFVTTGAEAVENSIKIARAATGRSDVIVFNGAFHGRTLLTMGMTGKSTPYKSGFGPFPGGIWRVPFPMPDFDVSIDDSISAIERLFKADVAPSQVAAIVFEPIQGEGGFHVAPAEFVSRLRALCTKHGILMVADEIQCGFGRTGRMFAMEHYGVSPDIVVMAKSLAAGFPLSAVSGRAEIMDAPKTGGLGGTYAGNPLAAAAALGVLDAFDTEPLLANATAMGQMFVQRLTAMRGSRTGRPIGNIRGLGGMIAFDLVKSHGSTIADPDAASALARSCLDRGLLLLTCGTVGETVRLLPPLVADIDILNAGLSILEASLTG